MPQQSLLLLTTFTCIGPIQALQHRELPQLRTFRPSLRHPAANRRACGNQLDHSPKPTIISMPGPLAEVQNRPQQQQLQQNNRPQHHQQKQLQQNNPMQPASTQELLPVFDLSAFLALAEGEAPSAALLEQCKQLSECLAKTGCLVVRDPRVPAADNDAFLDLMEGYFGRSEQQKAPDARPDLAYQVGVTPEGVEVPRCVADPVKCRADVEALQPQHRPTLPTGPDVKWRFFWRVGSRPQETQYPELNAAPVVPEGLPNWSSTMDSWGGQLLVAVTAVAQMAALGFGLPSADAFSRLMKGGPHLLAPTGSDLVKHGAVGTVLAGFHYDLNFITIHGKSRFPGLSVWLADGTCSPVSIPEGCLLCQAGKQLEWLTGGRVKAGMHEVVVTDATRAAVAAAQAAGRSCWRVSSTLFSHIASDAVLQPLEPFVSDADATAIQQQYPPVTAGQQVQQELEAIQLKKT